MIAKIEPTGCCERGGMVQVRVDMYPEEGDVGYDDHHVLIRDFTGAVYPGKVDERGRPLDPKAYEEWVSELPLVWVTNPYLCHIFYVAPETSDAEILARADAFLQESYAKLSKGEDFRLSNKDLPYEKPSVVTAELKTACSARAEEIKSQLSAVSVLPTLAAVKVKLWRP